MINLVAKEKQSVVTVTGRLMILRCIRSYLYSCSSMCEVSLSSAYLFRLYPNYYSPSLGHSYSCPISRENTRGKEKICKICYGREGTEPISL